MKYVYSLFLFASLTACSEPKHPDASALCDCYALLHHTNTEELAEIIADSCSNLYAETIKKLGKNKEELDEFQEAYDACR